MPRPAIPAHVKQEILEMIDSNMTNADISRETGVHVETIRIIKSSRTLTSPDGKYRGAKHIDSAQERAICEQYGNTDRPAEEILRTFRINSATLYAILRNNGISLRNVTKRDQREQAMNDAISMYKNNVPVWKIIQTTGISNSTLNAELHAREVPLRRSFRTTTPQPETREEIMTRLGIADTLDDEFESAVESLPTVGRAGEDDDDA